MVSYRILSTVGVVAMLLIAGCGEKKELTAEQKWGKFCESYSTASYYIMADRQQGVSEEKALEHMKGLPEGQQKEMFLALIKQANATPRSEQRLEQQKIADEFKVGKLEACLSTPHQQ